MFLYHTVYKKQINLGTRCLIVDVIKTFKALKPKPSNVESRWFEEYPKFCQLFHMKHDSKKNVSNHKVQEMWMIVNGVTIFYEMKEHALISYLNGRNYPLGYKEFGGRKFMKCYFKERKLIRLEGVKAKLLAMRLRKDTLKVIVIFFLGSVICAQTNIGT